MVVLWLLLMVALACQQGDDVQKKPIQVTEAQQVQRIDRLMTLLEAQLNEHAIRLRGADEDADPYFTFDIVRNERNGQVFAANLKQGDVADDDMSSSVFWGFFGNRALISGSEDKIKYVVESSNGPTAYCSDGACALAAAKEYLDNGGYATICKAHQRERKRSIIEEARGLDVNRRLSKEQREELEVHKGNDAFTSVELTFMPSYEDVESPTVQ